MGDVMVVNSSECRHRLNSVEVDLVLEVVESRGWGGTMKRASWGHYRRGAFGLGGIDVSLVLIWWEFYGGLRKMIGVSWVGWV